MDGTGAVHQVVVILHQVATVVIHGPIHAAVRALGIFLQFVREGIGIRRGAGDELEGGAVAVAGLAAGGHPALAGHEGADGGRVGGQHGRPQGGKPQGPTEGTQGL